MSTKTAKKTSTAKKTQPAEQKSAKVVAQQASLNVLRERFGSPSTELNAVLSSGKVSEFNPKRAKGALAVLAASIASRLGATPASLKTRINTYAGAIEPSTEAASERGVIAKSVGDSPYCESSFFGWAWAEKPVAPHLKCKGYAPKAVILAATEIGRVMAGLMAKDKALLPNGTKVKPEAALKAAQMHLNACLKA